jgi:hypothetical protein
VDEFIESARGLAQSKTLRGCGEVKDWLMGAAEEGRRGRGKAEEIFSGGELPLIPKCSNEQLICGVF